MKNFLFKILLITTCCFFVKKSFTQGFNIPNDTCPNVPITFTSPIATASNYQWDFCVGDLSTTPIVRLITSSVTKANMSRSEAMTTVFDGINWYGFVTNRTTKTLTRLFFGSSLKNSPIISNLGNINNTFTVPRSINVFKEGNTWYGIVLNIAGSIVRLNFGTSLNNVPTATALPAVSEITVPADLEVVRDENKTYIVVVNYDVNNPKLVILDFGSTINKSNPDQITETSAIPFKEGFSVRAIKDNGQWYAFVSNVRVNDLAHSPEVIIASFGSSLNNTNPTYRSFLPDTEKDRNYFFEVVPLRDGNNRFAFGITPSGFLFKFAFSNSFDNTPNITNLGRFDMIGATINFTGTPSNCLSVAKQESSWYAFTLNSNDPNQFSQI